MRSLSALADPTRRRIVEMLARGELSAGAIAERFTMSASAVSQHLRILREAKLVTVRVAAQQRIYGLDPTGLAELDAWLDGIAPLGQKRIEALERERSEGIVREPLRERIARGVRRVNG